MDGLWSDAGETWVHIYKVVGRMHFVSGENKTIILTGHNILDYIITERTGGETQFTDHNNSTCSAFITITHILLILQGLL